MAVLAATTLAWAAMGATPALAASNSFRYVDDSHRLPANTSPPGTDSLDVDMVDVDADGDLDLFVANGTASVAGRPNALYLNDGTGHFTDASATHLPPSPPANSTEVEFADVDGDGDLDGLVANLGGEQLLLNDGTGHFTDASATHLPPPAPNLFDDISSEVRLADVDGDGDPDVLVANENPFGGPGAQNRLWINDGTGHFSDQTVGRLPIRLDQTQGFAVGDIDDDGDLDAIVVNIGQEFVLLNDGAGHFADATAGRFPTTSDSSRKGVLADLDRDGDLDLFVGNSRGQESRLYLNSGNGVFSPGGSVPGGGHTTTDVEVVDLDQDRDLDLFVVNTGAFQSGHGFLGEPDLYLRNNKHARFQDKTTTHFPAVADANLDAAFGDLDGDGDLDLVVSHSSSEGGGLTLYLRHRCPGNGQNCA